MSDMFSVRGIGVDLAPELLDALLVRHAESLLLVDDEQAEIAEGDVFGEEPVRADDDVDAPGGQVGDDRLLLRLAAEAAHHLDAHGKAGEPLLERLLMLEGQHGRWSQKRDLLAVHDGLECRAHRDLGLAVAHVAAEEPVHGRRELHVVFDVGDRRLLVGGQLVFEGVLELALPVRVGAEGVARHGLPRRVELQ